MKSLENKIIMSTRPVSADDEIKKALLEKGATVIDFPMIKTVSKSIKNEIIEIVSNINNFEWLVFTSKNAVSAFFETYENYIDTVKISTCKIAVIGNGTASSLLKYGVEADFISTGKNAEKLSQELIHNQLNENDNVLLILGDLADDTLEKNLSSIVKVTRINVYKTIETTEVSMEIIKKIKHQEYDLILFTSPSTVRGFMNLMKKNQVSMVFKTACIGKTTQKEMISLGLIPTFIATEPNAEIFVNDIEKYLLK